jgi:hypothetical protein
VLERLEDDQEQGQSSLSQEERANLIDKGRIADETLQRAVGLREAENPHIREGILLRQMEDDPNRSRVDLDDLRRERIHLIEERRPLSLDIESRPTSEATDQGSTAAESSPAPEQEAKTRVRPVFVVTALFLLIAAGVGLGYKSLAR